MKNVDKVVEYTLGNAGKLTPEKILALAQLVKSLGGENAVSHEPNTIPVVENQEELTQDAPDSMHEVTGVQIDNGPVQKV